MSNTLPYFWNDGINFCTDWPYLKLAWIGFGLPIIVLFAFYGLYWFNFMPGKSHVRTAYWVIVVLLLIAVTAGSYVTVQNYIYPENVLCEDGGSDGASVITSKMENYKLDKDAAVRALYQERGIVPEQIQLHLALNNLGWAFLTMLLATWGLRHMSVHARYAPR